MNVQDLKKAGIRFSYSPDGPDPQIPYILDVLFTLRLVEHDKRFIFCLDNHPLYAANVLLAASMAATDAIKARRERSGHERIIAQAIVDLCPDGARCLFNPAYAEAWASLGHDVPRTSREKLLVLCGCANCRVTLAREGHEDACGD